MRERAICLVTLLFSVFAFGQTARQAGPLQNLWAGLSLSPVYFANAEMSSQWIRFAGTVGAPGQGESFTLDMPNSIFGPVIVLNKRVVGTGWHYSYQPKQGVFAATHGSYQVKIKIGGEPWRMLAVESKDAWEIFFVEEKVLADGSETVARCSILDGDKLVAHWDMLTVAQVLNEGASAKVPAVPQSGLAFAVAKAWQVQMDDAVIEGRPFAPKNDPTLRYRMNLAGILSRTGLRECASSSIAHEGPSYCGEGARLSIFFGRVPPEKQSVSWKGGILEYEVRDAWGTTLTPFWILRDSGKYYCGNSSNLPGSWWWYLIKR